MKKFIFSAVAAGALAFGGAAAAQDLGAILSNILGFGVPHQSQQGAAPVEHGPQGSIYRDGYGRNVVVEPNGRQVVVPGEVALDAYGRPMYRDASGNWSFVASGSPYDSDGDGVNDRYDRSPHDRNRW
jgi:hypothetical protein